MRMEKTVLDNQTRKELSDYFYQELHDAFFNSLYANMTKFKEKNKYFNLYEGITQFHVPQHIHYTSDYTNFFTTYDYLLNYISTYATSGEVWLLNYGQRYEETKVFNYKNTLYINLPDSYISKENFTLYVEHSFQSFIKNENFTKKNAYSADYFGYEYYFRIPDEAFVRDGGAFKIKI